MAISGVHNGQPVQMAVYRDKHGKPVAQKLRNANKHFSIIGDGKQLRLFGSHTYGNKGKSWSSQKAKLIACQSARYGNHKWATVSLPRVRLRLSKP